MGDNCGSLAKNEKFCLRAILAFLFAFCKKVIINYQKPLEFNKYSTFLIKK